MPLLSHYQQENNQKRSKLLRKVYVISVYWNKYKAKSENKNTKNSYMCIYTYIKPRNTLY